MDFCGCSPRSALLANHYLSFEVPAEISCETLSIPLRISPGVPIAMALWVILEIHQRVPLEMVSEVSPKVQKGVFFGKLLQDAHRNSFSSCSNSFVKGNSFRNNNT